MTAARRSIWTRWISFLFVTVLNLWAIYGLVPTENQKTALVFLAGTVAITGIIVLRLQKKARKIFIEVLGSTEIALWGSATIFENPRKETTKNLDIYNIAVWRREGHAVWIQRRFARSGLSKPKTVMTATIKPSFPGMIIVSRRMLTSETPGRKLTKAEKQAFAQNKSFTVQAVPESAFRELFDVDLWKVVGKLASLEDPLHQFTLSWRLKVLTVSIEGELEDEESVRVFIEMTFRIINRLIELGAKTDAPVVTSFTRSILTIKPDTTIHAAAQAMRDNNVGSAIIAESNKVPLGILTERDLCRRVLAFGHSISDTRAWKVMSQKIVSIKSSDSIERAYVILSSGQVRHVPVIEGRKVTGMVSITDLFRRLYKRWEDSAREGRISNDLKCDVFTRDLVTIRPDQSITEAAQQMKKHNVGSLVVMENGSDMVNLKGILTERDLCRRVVAEDLDPKKTLASDISTPNVVAIDITDSLDRAIRILGKSQFRHLPIRDGQKVVGVFSTADMVKFLQQTLAGVG